MGWFAKFKAYLKDRRVHKSDIILLVILLPCLVFLYIAWTGGVFSTRQEYPVSQGYQARMDGGWVYVLDSGHSTLTKASTDGSIIYRVSPGLYVDGFCVGEDGCVYLNASSFGGMTVVGEQILAYDSTGENLRVIDERDYGEDFLSKHAFHGVSEKNGELHYIECKEDEIVSHCVNLSDMSHSETSFTYANAFRSVSDACFDGRTLYILDRNGTLFRIQADGLRERIYNVDFAEEKERVPYRISVSDAGEVYYTDIRSRTVQHVLIKDGRSETVVEDTDSVTVDVDSSTGVERYILTDESSVQLPDGVIMAFRNSAGPMVKKYLACAVAAVALILAVILVLRVLNAALSRKRTNMQQIIFAAIAMSLITTVLTGSIMINSFRKAYTDKINEELIVCAVSTANSIRSEDVLRINEPGDYGSDAYLRLSAAMEYVFDRSIGINRNTYCNILRYDGGEEGAYSIAYLDGTIGTYYPLSAFETDETITVYETKKPVISEAIEDISGTYFGVKVPILDVEGNCAGVVSAGTQVVLLQELVRNMIVRVLTSILLFAIIAWFLTSEVIAYAKNVDVYRTGAETRPTMLPGHLFRLLIVLIFAAYNLEASFLPSYIMHQLPEGSENTAVLASLPYTVNVFIIGLTAIFCSRFVRGIGLLRTLMLSLALAFAGNLLIFLVPGYSSIMGGMALIGIGVGLSTNMMYVLLTYVSDSHDQVWGLSIYNAAVMAGINLGMVGGSVLAVLVGQRLVFAAGAGLWLLILLLSGGMMRKMSGAIVIPDKQAAKEKSGGLRTLFGNRFVPTFMICIQNPYVVFSSFVMYYLPIFCDEHGYSETSTALMLLCYAELSILVGDTMVERTRKWMGNGAMYAALGINILALLIFAWKPELIGMLAALLLLGLSASFGKPVQQKYFIDLPQVKSYGEDKAMGIYNFTENIGESAGPVVMAWLMFSTPLLSTVVSFCSAVTVLGALHSVIVRTNKTTGQ